MCHLIGLDSHVTGRTKQRVPRGIITHPFKYLVFKNSVWYKKKKARMGIRRK